MKKIFVLAALASTAFAGQALAADVIMPAPFVPAPVYDDSSIWEGMYAGLNAGYAWGNIDVPAASVKFDSNGFIGGAQIGYNWAMEGFLVGIEADYQYADIKYSDSTFSAGVDHFGTVRARVGADVGGFLPYITGGLAFGNTYAEPAGGPRENEYRTGWTVGGGVEAAVADNVSVKAEYLYLDFGNSTFGTPFEIKNTEHVVRLGVNFHF